jgi:hypothetical protein
VSDKLKSELNEESVIAFLQEIVDRIKTEEDPLELNEYRRLFRKVVPFHLRSYFAAYLLAQIANGKNLGRIGQPSRGNRNERRDRNERSDRNRRDQEGRGSGRADAESSGKGRGNQSGRDELSRADSRAEGKGRGEGRGQNQRGDGSRRAENAEKTGGERPKSEPRNVLPDDVSTTLFVSIGRNRRVYPRDLIGLILQNANVEREHIGDIRVLDNYSFVQVITEDAEKIIAALNEFEYRGRKLAVSFSRKRDEPASGTSDGASEGESLGSSEEVDAGDTGDTSDAYETADSMDSRDAGADDLSSDSFDEGSDDYSADAESTSGDFESGDLGSESSDDEGHSPDDEKNREDVQ